MLSDLVCWSHDPTYTHLKRDDLLILSPVRSYLRYQVMQLGDITTVGYRVIEGGLAVCWLPMFTSGSGSVVEVASDRS